MTEVPHTSPSPDPGPLLALAFVLAALLQYLQVSVHLGEAALLGLSLALPLVALVALALRRGWPAAAALLGSTLFLRRLLELALGSVILASFLPEDPLTAGTGLAGLLLRAGLAHPQDGAAFHLLVALCAVAALAGIFRRGLRPWRRRLGPVLAHLGLLLVLGAASVSHYVSLQGLLKLEEGRSSSEMLYQAPDGQVRATPLPFTIRLEDFRVKRQRQTGTLLCSQSPQSPLEDLPGTLVDCGGLGLQVQKEIRALPIQVPTKGPDGQETEVTRFVQTEDGARALLLGKTPTAKTELVLFPEDPAALPGSPTTLLWQAREDHRADFVSTLTVNQAGGPVWQGPISVNRPADVGPWRILQHGFSFEREDQTTLMIVYDPARPFLYVGLGLLCLGSVLLALRQIRRARRLAAGGEVGG